VRGNERSTKELELVDSSFNVLDSRVESLEFLSISLPLTPHQIVIG